jgi:Ca-activated chloride channel family protein
LTLEVELLGAAADLACSQHAVGQRTHDDTTTVSLSRDDERLDRDFVLRWRLAHDDLSPSLVCHTDDKGRVYGLLSLLSPRSVKASSSKRDVVFVLDRSGSMSGPKIASAARACALLLRTLGPSDRFALLAFDNAYEWFGDAPGFVVADEDGLARGERWLRGVAARGGTEIDGAVGRAYDLVTGRANASGRDAAIVVITDGQVGNESAVLARVQEEAAHARLFTVGVDTAVNSALIGRLAQAGGGTSALVQPGARLEDALVSIGRDIGHPIVADLSVEGTEGAVIDAGSLAPSRIGDLFGGRATSIAFTANAVGPVRVRGTRRDGEPFEVTVTPRVVALPAIAHVWAREHLTDLEDAYRLDPNGADALRARIVETSISHGVLTRFTAFLAVDEREAVKHPLERRTIVQPVEMPAGWDGAVPHMAMPFAAGAFAKSSGWTMRAHASPWSLQRLFADAPSEVEVPEPPFGAMNDLPALLETLARDVAAHQVRPPLEPARVRELRDKLAPLSRMLRGAARVWIDQLLVALDELLLILENRSRLDAALAEALARLEQLVSTSPLGRTPGRKRRFWDRGV